MATTTTTMKFKIMLLIFAQFRKQINLIKVYFMLQESTQELAFSNYKTFIQTSNCSSEIYTELTNTEKHLEKLTEDMPLFLNKCEEFKVHLISLMNFTKWVCLTSKSLLTRI